MLKNSTSLIILVWNEYEALKKIWSQIPFDSVDEVIFIDPGSTDGTVEFIKKNNHRLIIQKFAGRGNAFLEGLEKSSGENIIFFSGDGNEDPKDIQKVICYLNDDYSLVIAGRHLLLGAKSDNSDDPLFLRKSVTIIFGFLSHMIWKTGVKDPINGLRGIKREAMIRMKLDAPKHEIELQSTIRAAKLGLKIKEFSTIELKRAGGLRKKTAGSMILGLRIGFYLIREIFIKNNFINNVSKK